MPQRLTRIAIIRPSEIIGYAYMRDEDAPEGLTEIYKHRSVEDAWEYGIGGAAAALLPDDLFVKPITSTDPEEETVWEVYCATPLAKSHVDTEREVGGHMTDVRWLQVDQQVVADRINLDKLTREATRQARLVDHA